VRQWSGSRRSSPRGPARQGPLWRAIGFPALLPGGNFRNHCKVVVVDGVEGWVGGLNVGDEHLG